MRKLSVLTTVLLFFFSVPSVFAECYGTSCLPKKVKDTCTVNKSNGCIDWENGIIYAVGMGVPNPKFSSAAQRRYSAYEAAKTVAMRNLLQMVEGVNINSTKTVKAGMLENDEIQTQISGKLRQVEEVGQPVSSGDSSVWVTMRMYMRDIMSVLEGNNQFFLPERTAKSPELQSTPVTNSEDPEKKEKASIYGGSADQVYNGLIIDGRGTGVVPAMSPKIYDQNGKEVYGSSAVDREFAIKFGIAGYLKDLEKAKSNDRIKGNQLVLKAIKSLGKKSSDLEISNADGTLLNQLDAAQSFMREGRVIILID